MHQCGWRHAVVGLALVLAPVLAQADGNTMRLQCPPPPANCTYRDEGSRGEYFFDVSGNHIRIDYRDADFFALHCEDSMTLEDPSLPRFTEAARVKKVTFHKCAPPKVGSYASVANNFNVTKFSKLLLHWLPTAVVTHEHLAGLEQVNSLELFGAEKADVSLEPGALSALAAMPRLQHLTLHRVRTPAADLLHLPSSLNTLKQWYVGVDRVHFNSLPNLASLDVSEKNIITLNASNVPALKVLAVSSLDNVIPEDALPPTLTNLTLMGWNDTRPSAKTHCAQLLNFRVFGTNTLEWPVSLPDEWVANCGQLSELYMYGVPVDESLPARLLAHASALEDLTIQRCNLNTLPQGLLDDTRLLTSLDLSYNNLTSLPSGLFQEIKSLKTLNLSHNQFWHSVADSLSAVTSLHTLHLSHNPQLGDLCSGGSTSISVPVGYSPLRWLTSLRNLYLSATAVTHVCRDWLEDLLNLQMLDLRHTNIILLNLAELQFQRSRPGAKVLLEGKEFDFQYSKDNYHAGDRHRGGIKAEVIVKGSLVCDCNAYWTVMEFKRSSQLTAGLSLPTCRGKSLAKVDVDTLTCSASEQCARVALGTSGGSGAGAGGSGAGAGGSGAGAGGSGAGAGGACRCAGRDDDQHGQVVIVTCANLTRLPRLPAAEHKWRLHLAHNHISNITALTHANVTDVVEIDLRNNSIKRMDGQTARTLASVALRLGGNELECECDSYGMVSALRDPGSGLRDKVNVTCKGGVPLGEVPVTPCEDTQSVTVEVVAAVGVLLVVAAAAYTMLASSAVHRLVKRFLVRVGWRRARVEPSDEDRRFDVFVSYAHQDEELVVERLAARLESGARPYRLCLHYRDWAPGEWIPAQIAASVRASRRTLAVVSRHYLESGWARAEFREASAATLRDGTPRLVLVLLEEPAGLPLDAELHAYVLNNTYVRWGDPWFWTKLEEALPPPRPRTKARSPPAPCADIPLEDKCTVPESTPSPPVPPAPRHTPCSA